MAQEIAELLNRASELVYQRAAFGIAHALGTPLNVVSGHAELLLHDATPETQKGLRSIVAECRSISGLLAAPLEKTSSESRGLQVEVQQLIAAVQDLVSDEARTRSTIEAGDAGSVRVPRIDGLLALWMLAEIGARLSAQPFVIRAAAANELAAFTLACRTEHESPKTARELGEPWRAGSNRALGSLGLLCHALAAVRGGRPVLTRDGQNLEIRLEIG